MALNLGKSVIDYLTANPEQKFSARQMGSHHGVHHGVRVHHGVWVHHGVRSCKIAFMYKNQAKLRSTAAVRSL